MVQAWITSADETRIRVRDRSGKKMFCLVWIKRLTSLFSIKLSNSCRESLVYSYDQYHWCPFAFIVKVGFFESSTRYRDFMDGRAIKINRIPGKTVQIVSISCPSSRNLLKNLFRTDDIIKYKVRTVVRIRIIIL